MLSQNSSSRAKPWCPCACSSTGTSRKRTAYPKRAPSWSRKCPMATRSLTSNLYLIAKVTRAVVAPFFPLTAEVAEVILSLGLLESGLLRPLSRKLYRRNRVLGNLPLIMKTIWCFLKIKGRNKYSQVRQGRGQSSLNSESWDRRIAVTMLCGHWALTDQ